MGKRGRKPSERKGYFYEREEQAIVDYINETNLDKKNQIFNTILYPALTKMIESIIRRYKLFVPDEEFDQNFSDTISYLLTKINHFRREMWVYGEISGETDDSFIEMSEQDFAEIKKDINSGCPKYVKVISDDWRKGRYPVEIETIERILEEEPDFCGPPFRLYKLELKHYKAYSYCGTVCKNYLMYKCSQYAKKRQRNTPYDDVFEEISNSQKFSTNDEDYSSVATRLIKRASDEIEKMVNDPESNGLTDDEVKVGKALINLMRNWETVLPSEGSNKLQKSSILYYLREETMMTTKMVRDNMKCYKNVYYLLKKIELE